MRCRITDAEARQIHARFWRERNYSGVPKVPYSEAARSLLALSAKLDEAIAAVADPLAPASAPALRWVSWLCCELDRIAGIDLGPLGDYATAFVESKDAIEELQ